MKDNAKKNYTVIISAILIIVVFASILLYKDYSNKRNGKTFESRELILQENCDADYLICEKKVGGLIFSGYELSNGRTGLAVFQEENNKYRTGRRTQDSNDVPVVMMYNVDGNFSYFIFFNQPNMKKVEVTYEIPDNSGAMVEVTFDYDIVDYDVIYSKSANIGQPIRIVYYDTNGKEYRFVEHPKTREMYVKEN